MDLAKEPPCPKIVRGQKQLTPEQEAYARQFARERVAAMPEPEADEQAAEDHLRRACRVAGLAPPRIRWFDSPVAFNQARELTSRTERAQDQEAKDLWDDTRACVSHLQASMGFLPHRVSQRRLRWGESVQVAGEVALLIGGMFLITDWLPQTWNLPWRVWSWLVLIFAAIFLWTWIWARVVKRLRVVYHNHRTVVALKGLRRLVSILRRCPDPSCDAHRQVVGPEEAGRWALPESEVGLDVIAQIGSWRYHEHRSIPQMHQLLEERGVEIAQRTVTNALYRYDELVAACVRNAEWGQAHLQGTDTLTHFSLPRSQRDC